jgi:hypothetical protein
MPVIGPAYAITKNLVGQLLIFVVFFFIFQLLFAIVGNLLFFDLPDYINIGEAMITHFKKASGDLAMKNLNDGIYGYIFMLIYTLICFVLIMNLIVGQLSASYKKLIKKRSTLMQLETLSVREASTADEKYSAAVSPAYPISIINFLFGTYILSTKSPEANTYILHIYFFPVMLICLCFFIAFQVLILPLAYLKMVGHKVALIIKNPSGIGGKSPSNRFGYAMFFLVFGPVILAFNCIVDIYWFVYHIYFIKLDVAVQKQRESDKGFGIDRAVNSKTFKKILHYFEVQSSAEMQQITTM